MKFGGKVVLGPRKNPLDVGGNPDHVTVRVRVMSDVPRHTQQDCVTVMLWPSPTAQHWGHFSPDVCIFHYFFIKGLLLGLGGGM